MELLFSLVLYVIQIMKFLCIYELFLENKMKLYFGKIVLGILGGIAFFYISKLNFLNILLLYFLFIIGETIIIYNKVNLKMIFLGLWSTFVIGLLDEISFTIVRRLFLLLNYDSDSVIEIMYNLLTLLFLVVLFIILRKKARGKIEKIHITYYIFFFVLTFANTLIIIYLNDYVFRQIEVNNEIVAYIAFIGIAMGMFIEIAMVMLLAVSRNVYKEKNELNQKFLEEQKNHYKYLEERERETKLFRHDIRSHMNYIIEAWHEQKYDEAGKYIEEIYGRFEQFGNSITVHNGIVDAILNKYYSDAKKVQVSMNISGHLPVECNIEAFDLCTIFSNLLANAIEAASKSEKKCVEVECGYKDNKIMLSIKNDYNGLVEVKDGKYVTSKENRDYHGYGLMNVKRSVDKYSGYMNIEAEERFVVNIFLNNKIESKRVHKGDIK